MGISHPDIDVSAEAEQFREAIREFDSIITRDEDHGPTNSTIIEYICGEGDAPFGKYRLTLEAISTITKEEYAALKT